MLTNKDIRVEGSNLIINGEKHPLDPAVESLTKRANIVQGKFSALYTKLDAIEALEKTASGNPILITGAAAAYAMSNIMTIEPSQSGSGDPSPTNVRPISGISTASVQTTDGTDTNTASITLGQTVYGGSVNFKTGEVTVTHGYVKVSDLTWQSQESTYGKFYSIVPNLKYVDDEVTAISDIYVGYSNATKPQNVQGIYVGPVAQQYQAIKVYDAAYSSTSDLNAWKAARANNGFCYELATPTTLTLTPAELELLKGNNTITGNGANITITYIGR